MWKIKQGLCKKLSYHLNDACSRVDAQLNTRHWWCYVSPEKVLKERVWCEIRRCTETFGFLVAMLAYTYKMWGQKGLRILPLRLRNIRAEMPLAPMVLLLLIVPSTELISPPGCFSSSCRVLHGKGGNIGMLFKMGSSWVH